MNRSLGFWEGLYSVSGHRWFEISLLSLRALAEAWDFLSGPFGSYFPEAKERSTVWGLEKGWRLNVLSYRLTSAEGGYAALSDTRQRGILQPNETAGLFRSLTSQARFFHPESLSG